ncbi:dCTP pyrophosphatase 1 [Nematostella vectensis]|nr:dCTP pyrophosphatase 1 [Nematostella vectensis]
MMSTSAPETEGCSPAKMPRSEKAEKPPFRFANKLSLEDIRQKQNKFASEREWDQFHSPRNLLLAMVGEVGEVAELFQWKGEVKDGLEDWSEKERTHLGQELSDVLIYLVRLAEKCHVDLPSVVVQKIALNEKKYPVELVKGSSKKYTEYASKTT